MGEVKTPGQVAYEAVIGPEFVEDRPYQIQGKIVRQQYERMAQAVLAADPVRTQALELVESLALMVEGWHGTTSAFWSKHMIPQEAKIIADARELVRKAREGKA